MNLQPAFIEIPYPKEIIPYLTRYAAILQTNPNRQNITAIYDDYFNQLLQAFNQTKFQINILENEDLISNTLHVSKIFDQINITIKNIDKLNEISETTMIQLLLIAVDIKKQQQDVYDIDLNVVIDQLKTKNDKLNQIINTILYPKHLIKYIVSTFNLDISEDTAKIIIKNHIQNQYAKNKIKIKPESLI